MLGKGERGRVRDAGITGTKKPPCGGLV